MLKAIVPFFVSLSLGSAPFIIQALLAQPGFARGQEAPSNSESLNVNLDISALPTSVESFLALRDRHSTTPEGAIAIFLIALNVYGDKPELGQQFLTVALDARHLKDSQAPGSYKGKIINKSRTRDINRVLENSPDTARAYWKGAGPDNGYKADKPYAVNIYKVKGTTPQADKYAEASSGRKVEELKLFVMSEGYRNAQGGGRPISVAQNTKGIWKVTRFNGVVAAVMKPSTGGDDI
jgi:hypothetical protein